MAAFKMQRLLHSGAKGVSLVPPQQPSSWLYGIANIRRTSTYKAAVLREFGQELQIEDFKRKKLQGNQVSKFILHINVKFLILYKKFFSYCFISQWLIIPQPK